MVCPRGQHCLTHSFPPRRSSDLATVVTWPSLPPVAASPSPTLVLPPVPATAVSDVLPPVERPPLPLFPLPLLPLPLPLPGKDSSSVTRLSRPLIAPSSALSASPTLRSEEHTSELQSLMRISYAVFCLKKKTLTQLIK